ncbi:MAG: linear amide C-N hydrolase [Roseibium sp.]|uniref:linear amide C-N hydrolase n=1 Tax=Roseibium sp. TaxID=1936156 RepID=UPI00262C098E|nr:linear amide C-N hydrolase [Roseibium sp.]MCV0429376.1 linear amide C-N hydrolase [Roseibium sp.]
MRGIGPFRKWPFALHLGVCALSVFTFSAALACSTVVFRNQQVPLLAYNFDFEATDAGFLLINPSGASKRSVMDGNPASWSSRFGSVTVNQIGPGMPAAGMNSKGLVVSLMWNEEADYARHNSAPVLSELEFIQRLLDTSGSVTEALSWIDEVSIQGFVPIHYFLFDASGDAAILTPGEAKLIVHRGEDLPVPVLTNTSYQKALEHLKKPSGSGVKSGDRGSLARFRIAATALQASVEVNSSQAFDVLEDLATSSTRWRIVFNPVDKQINLRIGSAAESLTLDLTATDFSCQRRPHGANLRTVSANLSASALAPIDQRELADTMSEVLLSMKATAHLGRPEVTAGLSAGLLASSVCAP